MNKNKPGIKEETFTIVIDDNWLSTFNVYPEIEYISEPKFIEDFVEYTIKVKNRKKDIKKLIELRQLAQLKR